MMIIEKTLLLCRRELLNSEFYVASACCWLYCTISSLCFVFSVIHPHERVSIFSFIRNTMTHRVVDSRNYMVKSTVLICFVASIAIYIWANWWTEILCV